MREKPITGSTRPQTWVLYGPSGGGKTTLSATAPKPLFLDSNQGTLSIADIPAYAHVRSVDIKSFDHLDEAFANFTGTGKRDWRKLYQTAVFDHFDDLQAIVLDEIGDRRKQRDDRADPDEIGKREWGLMGTRMKRYVRKFKSVPIHKILICGEKEDRDTGRMVPSILGQLSSALPYLADNIAYLQVTEKGRRILHLDPSEDFYAKTRSAWLPPEYRKQRVRLKGTTLENPKFLTDLFALIAAGPKGLSTRGTTSGE